VRSAPGEGSTFTVTIPRVYARAAPAEEVVEIAAVAPAPAQPAGPAAPAARPRALVIDDEEAARYALASQLAPLGLEVEEAADPRLGLRRTREARPDVLFLDLIMPGLFGFEVLERLREDPATQDLPVVVVTSKALGPEEESRLAAQGAALLHKDELSRSDAGVQIRLALVRAGFPMPSTRDPEPTAP
jgi:CheY-like chemotaxis protein